MKKTITALSATILVLCVFHQAVSAVLGVSSLVLIGLCAAAIVAVIWAAPALASGRDANWRYENRMIRRPAS